MAVTTPGTVFGLTLLGLVVVFLLRLVVLACAASLMPMDPAKRLRFVVKEALHLKLKRIMVDSKALRGTDACFQDLSTMRAGVDLQVRSAEQLPRPDTPDVKIVNIRHVLQGT